MSSIEKFAEGKDVKAFPSGKSSKGEDKGVAHSGIKKFMQKAKNFFVAVGQVMASMAEASMEGERKEYEIKRQKNIMEGAMMFGDVESASAARKKYDALIKAKRGSGRCGPG